MLSAWRYDSDTKEVAVPRSYDPANGRSSKIQACKTCREKKTRCDGDGYNACNRCRCKGLACEYTSCGKPKRSPRLSKSSPGPSSICKPRPRSGRKHTLVGGTSAVSGADYDSSDTLSDKTVSPVPWRMGSLDVFDAAPASAAANFAIDPLLLLHIHDDAQQYAGFEHYTSGEFLAGMDVDTQGLATGTDMYHGLQADASYVSLGNGDDQSLRQCELRWLPNGLA
ncbi:hypothetical protein MAC_07842 [Metarhizium acridum CQMa 102]|uniref:Zn(2)-C6 fungal-type domain-containing protein n=1 Tax=Metarhizium acridum (strain CQMa 102) TaxID=655827 RepID=E9ED94_METAQ|nr:uncharacterized protein MAC_07842 [Metarhizium acridum CQMa 102]EFY86108.1 hypothetical protein MAC_07842 [Metarhizium acridum CQMa 102]